LATIQNLKDLLEKTRLLQTKVEERDAAEERTRKASINVPKAEKPRRARDFPKKTA
jgi:hypothetical protein